MARSSKNNENERNGCLKSLLSVATAGAILYGLTAPATAAIVVQRLGDDQSATEEQLPGCPASSFRCRRPTKPPLSRVRAEACFHVSAVSGCSRRDTAANDAAAADGCTRFTGLDRRRPGGSDLSGASDVADRRPYDPNSQSAGPGMGVSDKSGCNRSGASPGGLAAVPQPTPVSPLGMVPPDPSTGRYQMNTIPEATAPRQPAQVPQSSAGCYARQQAVHQLQCSVGIQSVHESVSWRHCLARASTTTTSM